jgi:hypothetical protein
MCDTASGRRAAKGPVRFAARTLTLPGHQVAKEGTRGGQAGSNRGGRWGGGENGEGRAAGRFWDM